jgi:hypothetical protein
MRDVLLPLASTRFSLCHTKAPRLHDCLYVLHVHLLSAMGGLDIQGMSLPALLASGRVLATAVCVLHECPHFKLMELCGMRALWQAVLEHSQVLTRHGLLKRVCRCAVPSFLWTGNVWTGGGSPPGGTCCDMACRLLHPPSGL